MINELSVKAKPSNNKARVAFYTALTVAALGAVTYLALRALSVEKSGLVGFIPLAAAVAAVFFYSKYISGIYYYDVTFDSSGYAVFVVRQVIGKRNSTLCRIGISEIFRVEREDTEQRRNHKTPKDHKRYSYLPTLLPEYSYRLITRSRYERSEIIIECSDEFAELIKQYAAEAREADALREAEDEY